MPKFLDNINRSLASKVVLAITVLIVIGGSLFWYSNISTERRISTDDALIYTASFSELIKKSIRYDMLTKKRDHIISTLDSLGNSKSIDKLQLLGPDKKIYYSTDKDEIGQINDDLLIMNHLSEAHLKTPVSIDAARWSIYTKADGHRALAYMDPIYNEPDCYTADCHAHSQQEEILGFIKTDFSLKSIDARIQKEIVTNSRYIVYFLAVTVTILIFILWKLVLHPVTALSKGIKMVSSGDLTHKVVVKSNDELGRLAKSFNQMTGELLTARKRMERWNQSLEEEVEIKTKEILRTQDKLIQAEKLAALGRLSADIAHEIRNPLTALGGFGRRLEKSANTEKQKQYAHIVVSETRRLEKILRDILIFSRDNDYHFQKNTVTELIKESVQFFDDLCAEKSITIIMTLESKQAVLFERDQVRQALDNLISNAIDAMPDGGILEIGSANINYNFITYVTISVADSGAGIAEEQLSHIFEPFFTSKRPGQGTGLGLSISKKIIEEHGGFIRAENKDAGGLVVSLFLPYQSDEDLSKTSCWEFMNCGRDKGGGPNCPAYPNFGSACWVVAGTLCAGKVQGTFAQKLNNCQNCDFFKAKLDGTLSNDAEKQ